MAINVVLSSHGLFAQEALKTAEMILGNEQKNAAVVSVTQGRTYEDCLAELQSVCEDFANESEGILILTDIFGGTPANIATYVTLTQENIQVYSGLNIPLLLELFLSNPNDLEEAKQIIERTYPEALVDITSKTKEGAEDGDRMDSY